MAKLFFSLAFVLLSINFMMSCGNTENTAEETTEAVSNAENTLKEKTKSAEESTYKTAAEMKQAVESLQTDLESEIKSLQAELNGATEEASQVIIKKISFYKESMSQLAPYRGKSEHINDSDAPDFGKNVANLISKIRRDMVSVKNEK